MAHRRFFLSVSLPLFLLLGLGGCSNPTPAPPTTIAVGEQDYGSGVYVVVYDDNAPNAVAAFLAKHPDLRVTAMYAAAEGAYGTTYSLMLVTEKR